ncbi:MAG: UDP-N-acetylmuramoyl-L-alanyl-D-glutamate--2,6-diaminopimelate ligase [Planctomycetota bacterium]
MELSELKPILLKLKGTKLYNFHNLEIKGISYNSKSVKPGDIFVAIPGSKTDGNYFIPEALQSGAITIVSNKKLNLFTLIPHIITPNPRQALAIISNYFFKYPSNKLKIIGITGTNGKTTTAYLLKAILEKANNKVGLLGTIEYIIGERQIPAPVTTPESYDLQRYFSQMLKSNIAYAVIEVSSHSLVLNRVFGIKFHRAVFTNITRDHLDFHKTPSRYRQAKAILFKQLSPESIAVLNLDDQASKYYAKQTPAQIIGYHLIGKPYFGTSRKVKSSSNITTSLVQAEIEESSIQGNSIILKTPIGEISIQSPLIGQHNVYNILAASATAISLGIPVDIIKEGIESVNTMRGRLELVETNTDYSVMVDFAHTDDALRNILCSLKPIVKGKIITVFGCGGDRDRGKRPLMGKVVCKYSDLFVITSDNPRSEDPLKIIKDIKRGIKRKSGCYTEPDRYEAIKKALSLARKNDLVLIAGKGHETYQIFKNTVKPFDDCEVVKSILSK